MSMNSFHARQGRPREKKAADFPVDRGSLPRIDALLVQRGLAASRTQAQRLIAAGRILWAGTLVTKPALELPADAELTVIADEADRYVSRGGLKLAGALAATGLAVPGKTCLDVGQSTGGFTDCLLQAGAARVVGVEVGHDQLAARLRADPRILTREGLNARALTAADLGADFPVGGFELIVGDVSFISLTLIVPRLPPLLAAHGDLLLLVKPQFEVGPGGLGKGGIVRDPARYAEVEQKIRNAAREAGLAVLGWLDSPITGGDGNREFFLHAKKCEN